MLPPEPRLPGVRKLLAQRAYFVVHAPRQTGKTTTLRALCRTLTDEGTYAALHFSCEGGQAVGDDYAEAQRAILADLRARAESDLPADLRPPEPWPQAPDSGLLGAALGAWARACPRPLVLVFDEIDALQGRSLVAVLRQLRAGHPGRGPSFPSSVILCGLRDVRDYKAASGGDPERLGTASPFNVLVDSMTLGNFTADEVAELYGQHTADTGQSFEDDALRRAFDLTCGQPWLVNALAREVVEKLGLPPATPVTAAHLDKAKERLIQARATHLDSLVARLVDDRVRRVIEPMLAGTFGEAPSDVYNDDLQYVRDLGLVAPGPGLCIANPVYNEVIVRVLFGTVEDRLPVPSKRSFILPDGRLDLRRVLTGFAAFWREHGEILAGTANWREVAAQLVLMAWLQRIVNGGGYVDREYGIGRGRIDLLVRWPWMDAEGTRSEQREALELKVWAPGRGDPLAEGLVQLDAYLERLGLDRGILVIFDRRPDAAPIGERTRFQEERTASGRGVWVLRG
ncbi:MAG: ATP-binding protein [Pseudomonadota bacterium]